MQEVRPAWMCFPLQDVILLKICRSLSLAAWPVSPCQQAYVCQQAQIRPLLMLPTRHARLGPLLLSSVSATVCNCPVCACHSPLQPCNLALRSIAILVTEAHEALTGNKTHAKLHISSDPMLLWCVHACHHVTSMAWRWQCSTRHRVPILLWLYMLQHAHDTAS